MDFHGEKPIYLQIADVFCENILSGALKADDRIPSVREYGAQIGVNPNTVMRVYEKLTADEIIERYNAVTAEDVLSLARRTFVREGLAFSAVGRLTDGERYLDLI